MSSMFALEYCTVLRFQREDGGSGSRRSERPGEPRPSLTQRIENFWAKKLPKGSIPLAEILPILDASNLSRNQQVDLYMGLVYSYPASSKLLHDAVPRSVMDNILERYRTLLVDETKHAELEKLSLLINAARRKKENQNRTQPTEKQQAIANAVLRFNDFFDLNFKTLSEIIRNFSFATPARLSEILGIAIDQNTIQQEAINKSNIYVLKSTAIALTSYPVTIDEADAFVTFINMQRSIQELGNLPLALEENGISENLCQNRLEVMTNKLVAFYTFKKHYLQLESMSTPEVKRELQETQKHNLTVLPEPTDVERKLPVLIRVVTAWNTLHEKETPKTPEELIRYLYQERGLGTQRIGRLLRVHSSTISLWLAQFGIPLNSLDMYKDVQLQTKRSHWMRLRMQKHTTKYWSTHPEELQQRRDSLPKLPKTPKTPEAAARLKATQDDNIARRHNLAVTHGQQVLANATEQDLEKLTPKQREIIQLHLTEGLSFSNIDSKYSIKPGSSWSVYDRAMKRLQKFARERDKKNL